MILIQIIATFMMASNSMVLSDFSSQADAADWLVVDDVVMGGRSNGNFSIDQQGYAVFSGKVSLENNGGFSSIRHRFEAKDVRNYSKAVLHLKGDGKKYQFRLKSDSYDRHSYIAHFNTSGEMQEIEIDLSDMYPAFRGRTLDMPNYAPGRLEEVAFLISNKKEEQFRLEIHKIILE